MGARMGHEQAGRLASKWTLIVAGPTAAVLSFGYESDEGLSVSRDGVHIPAESPLALLFTPSDRAALSTCVSISPGVLLRAWLRPDGPKPATASKLDSRSVGYTPAGAIPLGFGIRPGGAGVLLRVRTSRGFEWVADEDLPAATLLLPYLLDDSIARLDLGVRLPMRFCALRAADAEIPGRVIVSWQTSSGVEQVVTTLPPCPFGETESGGKTEEGRGGGGVSSPKKTRFSSVAAARAAGAPIVVDGLFEAEPA